MFLMNYNFMYDKNTIDPAPAYIPMASGLQLTNAIYDHLNVSGDGNMAYSETIPDSWDVNTIMNTDFHGNVNAGNVDYSTQDLAGIRIKRRIKGSFAWITLYDIALESSSGLALTKYDLTNQHGITYEYAFVPYLNTNVECAYIIKELESKCDGVFVCSPGSIVKFYGGLSYGNGSMANKTGVFEPLGSKYPIVVANADTQYYSGSLSATALTFNQLMNDKFDRVTNSSYLKLLTEFLTDHTTKLIKDWNGNLWLVAVTDGVQVKYNNSVGMGVGDVSFNFVEIGSAQDQETLEKSGFINIMFTPMTNTIPDYPPRPLNPVDSNTGSNEEYLSKIEFNINPMDGDLVINNSEWLQNMMFYIDPETLDLVFESEDDIEDISFSIDTNGNIFLNVS